MPVGPPSELYTSKVSVIVTFDWIDNEGNPGSTGQTFTVLTEPDWPNQPTKIQQAQDIVDRLNAATFTGATAQVEYLAGAEMTPTPEPEEETNG